MLRMVMQRAMAYVKRYEKDFAGIVAEEKYEQISRQGGRFDQFGSIHHDAEKRRVFRSDLLLVKPEGAQSWVQFRDVFEVDGKLVRDRNDRLAKLFLIRVESGVRQDPLAHERQFSQLVGRARWWHPLPRS